jgi:periplasmic divalent cation tolerance protein
MADAGAPLHGPADGPPGGPARARVVLITAPDGQTARQLARALVERRLAACVNLVPGITSIYRWQGAVEESGEVLMIAKTSAEAYPRLEAALSELHPYEVPECIALAPDAVAPKYLAWLGAEARPE